MKMFIIIDINPSYIFIVFHTYKKIEKINNAVTRSQFKSTGDQGFERGVTKVIDFIKDLSDSPRTREKVPIGFRKRMYNQTCYDKTRFVSIYLNVMCVFQRIIQCYNINVKSKCLHFDISNQ